MGCCLLIAPVYTRAQIIFTEIMYDTEGTDTGREWIEVQNVGSTTIDFSTWKLFEANTNHKITPVSDPLLLSQGFAIIVDNVDKFKADNPQFSGQVFDSTFSLSNDGETIVLRDEALADSDLATYSPAGGGQGDGTTFQMSGGGWITALPSLGTQTVATESFHPSVDAQINTGTGGASTSQSNIDTGNDNINTNDAYSAHESQSVATISKDVEELSVTAGRPRLGFVGAPLSFEAKIKTIKNNTECSLTGLWAMGDGAQHGGSSILHTYQFPGDYIVILNVGCGGLSAVSKIKVKIIEPNISLGFDLDGYAEIKNLSNFELNIGSWIFESEKVRFILPKDTLIDRHSSIKLAGATTHILFFTEYVRIANPSGTIISSISPQQITFKGESLDLLLYQHK